MKEKPKEKPEEKPEEKPKTHLEYIAQKDKEYRARIARKNK